MVLPYHFVNLFPAPWVLPRHYRSSGYRVILYLTAYMANERVMMPLHLSPVGTVQ